MIVKFRVNPVSTSAKLTCNLRGQSGGVEGIFVGRDREYHQWSTELQKGMMEGAGSLPSKSKQRIRWADMEDLLRPMTKEEKEMHRVFADGPITVLTLTLMFCFVCYTTSGVFEEFFKELFMAFVIIAGAVLCW